MKTTVALLGLMAASALAAPGTAMRKARHQRRKATGLNSKPMIPANIPAVNGPNGVHTEYSQNWAGAVLIGSGYTGVTGTFKVPAVSAPSGGDDSTSYSGSAWVGIDGDTCETAILQTGVDFTIQDGQVSYDAWYEWYPDYAYNFDDISFSEGDTVKVTVKATSTTAGTATVENVSTGQTVSHTFKNEGSEGALCQTNAEWIVEDYEEGSSLVSLIDFGTITFTGAQATTKSGTVGVSGATLIDMSESGSSSNIEARASTSGSSEVIVKYV